MPKPGFRTSAAFRVLAVCAVAVLLVLAWVRIRALEGTVDRLAGTVEGMQVLVDRLDAWSRDAASPVSPFLLRYELDLPGRGEVFPAMSTDAAADYWPVGILTVANGSDRAVAQVVSAGIRGWSVDTEQSLVVGPGESRKLEIRPELLPRALANREIREATLAVRARGVDGNVLYAESRSVLVHGGSEIYWGRRFANAQMAARWVTPHQRDVAGLVGRARSYVRNGRLAGYGGATGDSAAVARHVRDQARAVFRALQDSDISYVSGIFVMGEFVDQAQRVRLPHETLNLKSANCMDLSVVFASAMENLGMQPMLVILPGHAVAGVRLGEGADDVLHLDLTVLPGGGFDAAIARARKHLRDVPGEHHLVVDVAAARALGIYPLVDDVFSSATSAGSAVTTTR